MYTVLVADHDRVFNQILSSKVNDEGNCQVVAQVYDGKNAILAIEDKRPAIIIIDFILPETDGLNVVEYIRHCIDDYNPVIYVLSSFSSGKILDELTALNVDFFNMKPISLENVLHNLSIIVNAEHKKNNIQIFPQRKALKNIVKDLVLQFGVFPHRLSTKCIIDALLHYIDNSDDMQALTKTLYPEIAKKHNITNYAVEKNIRSGIEIMQKAGTPLFASIFPYAENKRVTNGEFLATIAYYLDEASTQQRIYSC